MNEKKRWVVVSVGLFLAISFLVGVLIKGIIDKALYNKFPDRGVPRINIDLSGVTLDEIKSGTKDVKYGGNSLQVYDNGEILGYEEVEIKGRGNGTWTQEKKPFQIKFENKVDMFGMGRAKKWYLLANALDPTHLRNYAANELSKMLGMEYNIDGRFVEVYCNGEYEGLYYLTHAIEISRSVINLKDENGILVELDNFYGNNEEHFETRNGDYIVIKDLVSKDNKEPALTEFLNKYNDFEMAIEEKNYERIKALVNVESFARYYLVSEFSVNPDAYWTSFYMYKDGKNDKIHAGPVWDFDMAFGNRNWISWMNEKFYSPNETMVRKNELRPRELYEQEENESGYVASQLLSTVIFDLMEIPEFRKEVINIYVGKMQRQMKNILNSIRREADNVRDLAIIDSRKWNGEDFDESIINLMDWCEQRYKYFEDVYGSNGGVIEVE